MWEQGGCQYEMVYYESNYEYDYETGEATGFEMVPMCNYCGLKDEYGVDCSKCEENYDI